MRGARVKQRKTYAQALADIKWSEGVISAWHKRKLIPGLMPDAWSEVLADSLDTQLLLADDLAGRLERYLEEKADDERLEAI
jgi:hypothetical protein